MTQLGWFAFASRALFTLQQGRTWGFPGGSVDKESACSVGDVGSIPGSGRSPGGRRGNPLQYSCWRIPSTEEPGGLQSMGLQRVGHDGSDLAHTQGRT